VLDPGQYDANPDGLDTSLKLFLGIGARETSSEPGKFETRAFHNLMSEGDLNFWVKIGNDDSFLVAGGSYGSFSPTYTQTPVANSIGYIVRPDNVTRFYAEGEVGDLADKAFLELALGFVGVEDCKVPPQGLQQLQWLRIFADGTSQELFIQCSGTDTEEVVEHPKMFRVLGNYPNPFNPATTVQFDLAVGALVRVDIYDLLGRRVLQVPEQSFSAGPGQQIRIDASDLASGTYIYRVVARNGQTTYVEGGHMTLLK
jgi:hypothetical protein